MNRFYHIGISLFVIAIFSSGLSQEKNAASSDFTVITYKKNILPLLQANCNPCHFPEGKVYKKLPAWWGVVWFVWGARSVLELPAGSTTDIDLQRGDQIVIS